MSDGLLAGRGRDLSVLGILSVLSVLNILNIQITLIIPIILLTILVLVALMWPDPIDKPINGHGQIVELHAAVGIESFLVVEYDAQALHGKPYRPQPDAGLIFQQDVGQSQHGGEHVEPMGSEKFCHNVLSSVFKLL